MTMFQKFIINSVIPFLKPADFTELVIKSDLWYLLFVSKLFKQIVSEQLFCIVETEYEEVWKWCDESYNKLHRLVVTKGVLKRPLPIFLTDLRIVDQRFMTNLNSMTNLKTLILPIHFNLPITPGLLPISITLLEFGFSFNQRLTHNVLPPALTELCFGYMFNQPLAPGVLPESLTTLILGNGFNQKFIIGSLPSGLKRLIFGERYVQAFDQGVLPSQLNELSFPHWSSFKSPSTSGILPLDLSVFNLGITDCQQFEINTLSSKLTELTIGCWFDHHNFHFNRLHRLGIHGIFNKPLNENSLPPNLRSLTLGQMFNQPIKQKVLPDSLISLKLGTSYNQPIEPGTLPRNLLKLSFGKHFNQVIEPGTLPRSLIRLKFGEEYNKRLIDLISGLELKKLKLQSSYPYLYDLQAFYSHIIVVRHKN